MTRVGLLVCVISFFVFPSLVSAQSASNKGKDFYLPYAAHVDALTSQMTLILSADFQTDYKISVGNTVIATGSIAPNTSHQEVINPNTGNYIGSSESIETNKAIRVETTKAISLYSIISHSARTGGTMVIPVNTLGKDYYVFSHENGGPNGSNVYSQFTILATKDGTKVNITPKQSSRTTNHLAGVTFTISLNAGDIYQYQSVSDLTGSYITSTGDCQPIAVFSGNTWASFCESGSSRSPSGGDNLFQQLFPISAWGKNFVTSPFYNTLHGNTDAFRIIVAEDNTTITVNGSTTDANGSLLANPYPKGAVINFFSTGPNVVSSDRPIALAHYQTSQTCNLNNSGTNVNVYQFPGDPEITMLNPVEQTLNDITVFSNIKSIGVTTDIVKYYINVVIKTEDVASFKLDGIAYSSSFNVISGSSYSCAVIDVTNLQAQHRLTAAGGFSAIAYGYGRVESYAYLAGANVQSYTFQTTDLAENLITSGCEGQGFKLKINLTGEASQLIWNLGGANVVTQDAPVATPTIKDGIEYYTYSYPVDIDIAAPGDYTFNVKITYKNTTNCGNTEEINSGFTIYEKPNADFNAPSKICFGSSVSPVLKSTNANVGITKWKWEFDDEIIEEESPTYTFNKLGEHTIKLSVSNQGGCWSDVVTNKIMVNPVPVADFKILNPTCVLSDLQFSDQSTVTSPSTVTKWEWFSDDVLFSTIKNPTHNYSLPGSYKIKLIITTAEGCTSEVIKSIVVRDLPKADFILPDVCSNDGVATFVNTSIDAVDGDGTLTYKWNFGDPTGTASSNVSADKDGKHQYVNPGPYTVTLTVTNLNGCEFTTTKNFIVNGRVDKAEFKVHNPENLCSNNDVIITSGFTALIGKIVKLEIYKDYNLDGTNTIYKTVMYPNNVDDIALTYASFGGNTDKKFTIRIVGYTGDNAVCTKEALQEITLKPVPQLSFNDLTSICENDGTVEFTNASETSGIIGKGEYSTEGKGLAVDGLFNPKVAGIGFHNITYTYKAENGCESSITKTIEVYESPIADAGQTLYILAGGQITIPAIAEGSNLKYQWLPAVGLDKVNVLNPLAAPEKDTEYTLNVTTQPDGCIATTKVLIKVLEALNPPNTFTPNGDNINDTWIIKYLESYPNATVEVFNRNGNRVFFSNAYKIPFDGNYQNEPLPVGVYYYIINPRNGRKSVTGPLTIIR
ncbi:T9SS type B sorting domain-containing protein [Pedobacter frigidisoli]|uniref:T9SS type B sorting domain-containing protein n=1 Tax=Pedobacter frigidisoli TaxID=2530455 RepID=A0A4R0P5V0_9SPHI|nr:PKD domain-containing protein [Pedobacter frigidisoli]TCD08249.1 T9SS type B sorting domain-containing protein [Pedobacter frigidisoli]